MTLPRPLALFPLQSVLFPEGRLQLRVFEPRYLDLMRRCEASGEPFGVVSLIQGNEVREREGEGFRRESFHAVGTLAELTVLQRPQPGLMLVRARGAQRFKLGGFECLAHGLWVGDAQLMPEDQPLAVPEEHMPLVQLLQSLFHQLGQGASNAEMPIQPPYAWQDCGWVANRWCELLPLADADRQRLMQLDNPLLRLELVADELERQGIR